MIPMYGERKIQKMGVIAMSNKPAILEAVRCKARITKSTILIDRVILDLAETIDATREDAIYKWWADALPPEEPLDRQPKPYQRIILQLQILENMRYAALVHGVKFTEADTWKYTSIQFTRHFEYWQAANFQLFGLEYPPEYYSFLLTDSLLDRLIKAAPLHPLPVHVTFEDSPRVGRGACCGTLGILIENHLFAMVQHTPVKSERSARLMNEQVENEIPAWGKDILVRLAKVEAAVCRMTAGADQLDALERELTGEEKVTKPVEQMNKDACPTFKDMAARQAAYDKQNPHKR